MTMQRRSFLRAIFGSVAAGGVLLKAEPRALELFKPVKDEPLIIQKPQIVQPGNPYEIGERLYNECGEPVCDVINYSVTSLVDDVARITIEGYLIAVPFADRVDVTMAGNAHQSFVPGLRRRRR